MRGSPCPPCGRRATAAVVRELSQCVYTQRIPVRSRTRDRVRVSFRIDTRADLARYGATQRRGAAAVWNGGQDMDLVIALGLVAVLAYGAWKALVWLAAGCEAKPQRRRQSRYLL